MKTFLLILVMSNYFGDTVVVEKTYTSMSDCVVAMSRTQDMIKVLHDLDQSLELLPNRILVIDTLICEQRSYE